MKIRSLLIFILLVSGKGLSAQLRDSVLNVDPHTRDSSYTIHENVPKSKTWGNSTYFSVGYNWSRSSEFDFNLGRTYGKSHCSGGGCIFSARSFGVGSSLVRYKGNTHALLKMFWEFSFFYYPPISFAFRAEYLYDVKSKVNYLRPSAGLSLLFLDVLYNYSFKMGSSQPNLFRHGVIFRFKYFYKMKNWQKNYPSRC